jgi:endoglucanase
VQKLDADPAVRRAVTRLDHLVVPNWYYQSPTAKQGYPTLLEARKHAVVVIPDRGCTHHRDGAANADAYQRWIDTLLAGLGPTKAAIIMEPDAIAADCYDAARAATLTRAVTTLANAGQFVCLDAGHSAWLPTGESAQRLIASGITHTEGFAVNVANRQTTGEAQRWGMELSDLVGGREFVVDTSRNGVGPPPDETHRDDEWCNPDHQALGQPPTTRSGCPASRPSCGSSDPEGRTASVGASPPTCSRPGKPAR